MKFYNYFESLIDLHVDHVYFRDFIDTIRNVEIHNDYRFRLQRPFARINENTLLVIIDDINQRDIKTYDVIGAGISIPEFNTASIRVNRLKPRGGWRALLWRVWNAIAYDKERFVAGWMMDEESQRRRYNVGEAEGGDSYVPAVENYTDYIGA